MRRFWVVAALWACGGDDPVPATANPAREIVDTKLSFDVAAHTGKASITFAPSTTPGATLEVNDLGVGDVLVGGEPINGILADGKLDLGLAASTKPTTIELEYTWSDHESFMGASKNGYTLIWPYYCGNLFPCHSRPDDGTTFSLELTGVPADKIAIYPATIPGEAPAYQIAWAIGQYTQLDLGTTTAGTLVSIWHLPGEETNAQTGGAHLVAAFDWFEKTLGPYKFGDHVGTVSVAWPRGAFGGMEHHPRWHIGSGALSDEETNVHEAAHGWFGDGIRVKCWEDFVLSEGTVSYLAARALDVVAPTVGAQVWQSYADELSSLLPTEKVWPQSCGAIDIIKDNLFSRAPYMRGAYFYKGLADKLGAEVVDHVLSVFYQAHAGGAATMQDMLDTIKTETGYDATACAQTWLLDMTQVPTPAACP